ncbi:Hypothetical predicted protein [Podarcis lilfordi]|uniref:Uncharacterized protein n=1 Tax=Podarcis lilfordi TaxID=74358 RepID=A0AA35PJF8_9SAUR|nr:Hypothetical predicted protein [Podarcis lilfordi]
MEVTHARRRLCVAKALRARSCPSCRVAGGDTRSARRQKTTKPIGRRRSSSSREGAGLKRAAARALLGILRAVRTQPPARGEGAQPPPSNRRPESASRAQGLPQAELPSRASPLSGAAGPSRLPRPCRLGLAARRRPRCRTYRTEAASDLSTWI